MIREKAIEWFSMLKEKFVNTEYEKYLEMAIKALEQEPKTGRWIPVSERLPNYREKVLVCYETEEGLEVDTSMFDKYGCRRGNAVAWMPLPEPYKASPTEEEI